MKDAVLCLAITEIPKPQTSRLCFLPFCSATCTIAVGEAQVMASGLPYTLMGGVPINVHHSLATTGGHSGMCHRWGAQWSINGLFGRDSVWLVAEPAAMRKKGLGCVFYPMLYYKPALLRFAHNGIQPVSVVLQLLRVCERETTWDR